MEEKPPSGDSESRINQCQRNKRIAIQNHLTNICSLCQKDTLMCACEKWFCEDCFQNEINEWAQYQDETSLGTRVNACTHCGISTLCSLCAIAAFIKAVECVDKRNQTVLNISMFALDVCSKSKPCLLYQIFLPLKHSILYQHLRSSPSLEPSWVQTQMIRCMSSQLVPGLLPREISLSWHGIVMSTDQLKKKNTYLSTVKYTMTPDSPPFEQLSHREFISDYEPEEFDVGCSDEDFPDWADFCVMSSNIRFSQGSPLHLLLNI